MPSINEQLLRPGGLGGNLSKENSEQASAETEGALTATRRGTNQAATEDQGAQNSAEAKRAAINQKKATLAAATKQDAPVSQKSFSTATSGILRSAWTNIIASFGFTFLYVYAHLFLKNVFGERLFAPLGSEWFDKPGNPMAARDRLGSKLKLPEMMLVLVVSLILFFAVISLFSLVALITEAVSNPLRTFLKITDLWSFVKGE